MDIKKKELKRAYRQNHTPMGVSEEKLRLISQNGLSKQPEKPGI